MNRPVLPQPLGVPRIALLTQMLKWAAVVAMLVLAAIAGYVGTSEILTSRLQARYLSAFDRGLTYRVGAGPSRAIHFPAYGPYDVQFGYTRLPEFSQRLARYGFAITAQARDSRRMLSLAEHGLYLPYAEKDQAGLVVRDANGQTIFAQRRPVRIYRTYDEVPPLLISSLVFVEDRDLFNPAAPHLNPAIDWRRFALALLDQVIHLIAPHHVAPGGSTLTTQIVKYRHSPNGRTVSRMEKLRQMASASLHAYLGGPLTLPARQQIVVDYLNTVPLSAKTGYGEIHGIGDGMWAWYGRSFAEMNRVLSLPPATRQAALLRASIFKQALSLVIAQRAPTFFLGRGQDVLEHLTDSYLRLLAGAGVIPASLRDAALAARLHINQGPVSLPHDSYVLNKAATVVSTRLSALLGVPRAYDLNQLDLTVSATLNKAVQQAVNAALARAGTPAGATAAGLYGFEMLRPGDDPSRLAFSFMLFERRGHANLLRVSTDNRNRPFNLNQGARLNLGSTAKLRTLIYYLQIVTALHQQYAGLSPIQLSGVPVGPEDKLSQWAIDYLEHAADTSLPAMLQAAMERTYSANPTEVFYTGGGEQTFHNFEPSDNTRVLTIREAFQRSVNLVFVRLMRDIVRYDIAQAVGSTDRVLSSPPLRQAYLMRFADQEGSVFGTRFYQKYHGKTPSEALALLLQGVHPEPAKIATVLLSVEPGMPLTRFEQAMRATLPSNHFTDSDLQVLYAKYGPGKFSLNDQGYIAGVHPLELWTVAYLRHHPNATLQQTLDASRTPRQEVYQWLFKSRQAQGQDRRIKELLEQDAFGKIDQAWRALGYPFSKLTPSYATAIGASGDRPEALAELMGVIASGGLRLPQEALARLDFAEGTPYETHFAHGPVKPVRVLPAAIVDVVRQSLRDVVDGGTGKRIAAGMPQLNGSVLQVSGKTGTGDQRYEVFARGRRLIASRKVARTATFVFMIGNRFFGALTAYVHEPYAARYTFTSAMAVQLLKALGPQLEPLMATASPSPIGKAATTGGSGAAGSLK